MPTWSEPAHVEYFSSTSQNITIFACSNRCEIHNWTENAAAASSLAAACCKNMMTSSNGNVYRVTGHLCGEFTGDRGIHRGALMFSQVDLRLNKRLSKQSCGWWFETLSRPLWRHCNDDEAVVICLSINCPTTQFSVMREIGYNWANSHCYCWYRHPGGWGTCYVTGGVPLARVAFLSPDSLAKGVFWQKFLSQGYSFLPKSLAKGIFLTNPPTKWHFWG